MLTAIERFSRRQETNFLNSIGEDEESLHLLNLHIELLKDFCSHGLFQRRLHKQTVNEGKLDWKRTAKRQPWLGKNKRPIYFDIDSRIFLHDSVCDVSAIHADVIRSLDRSLGWIITKSNQRIAPELDDFRRSVASVSAKLNILKRAKRAVFAEREQRLLQMLIQYFESKTSTQKGVVVAGIKNFEHVWEHMLRDVLGEDDSIKNRLPIPVYKLQNGEIRERPSPRIDIFLRDPKTLKTAVVDAKYYSGKEGGMPGWADMVKQFFYAVAAKDLFEDHDLVNAFVFPGTQNVLRSGNVKERASERLLDENFPPIHCLYIEPNLVVEAYLRQEILQSERNQIFDFATSNLPSQPNVP